MDFAGFSHSHFCVAMFFLAFSFLLLQHGQAREVVCEQVVDKPIPVGSYLFTNVTCAQECGAITDLDIEVSWSHTRSYDVLFYVKTGTSWCSLKDWVSKRH